MKKIGILILIAAASTTLLHAQDTGKELYKTYCAGCHGAQLEGNSAAALIKSEWKYGRSRGAMIQNVTYGIPDTEMSAFGNVLEEKDVEAVVDYIISVQDTPPSEDRPIPSQVETDLYTLQIEKMAEGEIETPWGITFIDEHHALFTERKGTIRQLVNGKLDPQPIKGVPPTQELRTGGYMDIAVDPHYEDNGWVYLAFSYTPYDMEDDNARAMTKIVRGRIQEHQWTDEQTLFEVPDSLLVRRGNRWGSRFLFDDKGYLYFSIGDMARGEASQDIGQAPGKVYRIHRDGTVPPDNPYARQPGALGAIFSIGNRNVQGIDQHPETGDIWATEHGPMGGDELNILKKGANYGWPTITYGVDYDGTVVSDKTHQPGMEQPVVQWTPSIAVCPAKFSDSPLFPEWEHNLLVGALKFEELRRLVIQNNDVVDQEIILKDYGRVRDIEHSPNGVLYVLLNNPDMILRITPK
ncbi:PQQ-dependent sugar dehydrogenase [Fodinibius sediminis]|uniref:PQQ-dependent sugar dehydrogenase n=1 Tax=Fodinibius sediminis TaxID=1214077 RepID=UPI00115A03E1|nr:PQQ-dependent sugar dehydrogenase [Fodinibius sediminis]